MEDLCLGDNLHVELGKLRVSWVAPGLDILKDNLSDRRDVPVSARCGAVCYEYKVDRPEIVDNFIHIVKEF